MQKRLIKGHAHCPHRKEKYFALTGVHRHTSALQVCRAFVALPNPISQTRMRLYPDIGNSERSLRRLMGNEHEDCLEEAVPLWCQKSVRGGAD